jgi:four helix bundle protein
MGKLMRHQELHVFELAFKASMTIFGISRDFRKEEKYSMIGQIRRSSSSDCKNLTEAFRKRKYPNYFVAKFMNFEGEAAETQVWLLYALNCKNIHQAIKDKLHDKYNLIISELVIMGQEP